MRDDYNDVTADEKYRMECDSMDKAKKSFKGVTVEGKLNKLYGEMAKEEC